MKGRKPKLRLVGDGATANCPGPPTWFHQHARDTWARIAPTLHRRGLLVPDVMQTVEAYCVAAGQVVEFEATMTNEGRLVADGDGGKKPHPAFKMQQAAMREARLLAGELGLTPHRRPADDPDKPAADAWGELLA
jgi:P27 family predicted phage terminase small subunit